MDDAANVFTIKKTDAASPIRTGNRISWELRMDHMYAAFEHEMASAMLATLRNSCKVVSLLLGCQTPSMTTQDTPMTIVSGKVRSTIPMSTNRKAKDMEPATPGSPTFRTEDTIARIK